MPIQPCPSCGVPVTRRLDFTSQYADVNYYICERCGHIWTISKDGTGEVTHVTQLPDRDDR